MNRIRRTIAVGLTTVYVLALLLALGMAWEGKPFTSVPLTGLTIPWSLLVIAGMASLMSSGVLESSWALHVAYLSLATIGGCVNAFILARVLWPTAGRRDESNDLDVRPAAPESNAETRQ